MAGWRGHAGLPAAVAHGLALDDPSLQGAATQDIVRNVEQASSGTSAVTGTISGVAGAAEKTGGAARDVLTSATALSTQAEHLTEEVQRFLATVRAA